MTSTAPPSKILAGIQTLEDLSRDNFQHIFRHHFNNKELMVKRLPNDDDSGGGGGSLEHLTGNNDFYNSDIRMLRIGIIRDPDLGWDQSEGNQQHTEGLRKRRRLRRRQRRRQPWRQG